MKELAMFAGAGGGILGSMLLGHQIVGANEYEEYPCKVLRQRQIDGALPEFPIWHMDIREFNKRVAPSYAGMVDIVSGGFPCQDISCAGKGAGIEGERSGLWKELAETIRIIRPSFAFLENSPMLTARGLGTVLQDLAEMGFNAEWCCMGASDVGAPHKRERIWILAYSSGSGSQRSKQQGALRSERHGTETYGPITERCCSWWDEDPADVPDADQARFQTAGSKQQTTGPINNRASEERTAQPAMGRVAHGIPHRVDRLKAIGNGQCPQCMAAAFGLLMEAANA